MRRNSHRRSTYILGWTISALGDDDSPETIIGFFNSKLIHLGRDFDLLLETIWGELDEFMYHTLSSNMVTESVKPHLDIFRDMMNTIPCSNDYELDNLRFYFD
jgi:hypothetical protein